MDEARTAEALTHAVEALRRSERALTAAEILRAVPAGSRLERNLLETLLSQDSHVVGWPPRTAKARPRFWTRRPEELAAALVTAALGRQPLTLSDLQKKAGRELAGFAAEEKRRLIEAQVEALLAASRLFVHPLPGKTRPKYATRPALAGAYVGKLRKDLDALAGKLAVAGITRAQILAAMAEDVVPPPAPPAAEPATPLPPPLAGRIVEYLKSKPGGIGVVQLREEFGLSARKAEFDQAVLELYRQRRVQLDPHDWPRGLSEAAREELVTDGAGNYFVVVSLRDADAESLS